MKKVGLIGILMILGPLLALNAAAQESMPTESNIGFLNLEAFYQTNTGINRIVNVMKSLDAEFKSDYDNLESLKNRIAAIEQELRNDQNAAVPLKPAERQQKADEASRLQLEFNYKKEASQANYTRREQQMMAPILQDIEVALGEFAKQKGLTLVLDTRNMSEAQVLVFVEPANEITEEFIGFYNARQKTGAAKTPE